MNQFQQGSSNKSLGSVTLDVVEVIDVDASGVTQAAEPPLIVKEDSEKL